MPGDKARVRQGPNLWKPYDTDFTLLFGDREPLRVFPNFVEVYLKYNTLHVYKV